MLEYFAEVTKVSYFKMMTLNSMLFSVSHDVATSERAQCPRPRMNPSYPRLTFTPLNAYGCDVLTSLSAPWGPSGAWPFLASSPFPPPFSGLVLGAPPICIRNLGMWGEANSTFASTGVLLKLLLLKSRPQRKAIGKVWKPREASTGKPRCTHRSLRCCRQN